MKLPKISIITPSYNQGQFIEETILSILNQDYPYVEYMIIDGGSSDNTVEIIKKYEKRLSYWVSEKDSGQSDAINKGFRRATGDIVCWINSDDFLMPDALRKVGTYFQQNKDLDFVNGYSLLIDIDANIVSNHFIIRQKKWYAKRGIYYISQPAMFWKRDIFDSIGYLREDFHALMDRELLIRIFENDFKIGHLGKILAAFRMHDGSKSSAAAGSKICLRDSSELRHSYGNYGQKPKLVFRLIYGFEKLVKGIYFEKWYFTWNWKGKRANELNYSNCKYLK